MKPGHLVGRAPGPRASGLPLACGHQSVDTCPRPLAPLPVTGTWSLEGVEVSMCCLSQVQPLLKESSQAGDHWNQHTRGLTPRLPLPVVWP